VLYMVYNSSVPCPYVWIFLIAGGVAASTFEHSLDPRCRSDRSRNRTDTPFQCPRLLEGSRIQGTRFVWLSRRTLGRMHGEWGI